MINFIQTNWKDILEGIAAIIGVASVIVRLTPSNKDNIVFNKVLKFLSKYIALNTTKYT